MARFSAALVAAAAVIAAANAQDPNADLSGVTGCRNTALAPTPGPGGTFITDNCGNDNDCASRCCAGNKCRAPLSLVPGGEFCGNGFSPNFGGPPCPPNAPQAPPALAPAPVPGQQFFQTPTCRNIEFGPVSGTGNGQLGQGCVNDNDCFTGCCDNKGTCRLAFELQTGVEFCRSGFTPVFVGVDNKVCGNAAEAIGAPTNETPTPAPTPRAANNGDNLKGFTVPDCRNTAFAPTGFGGSQFITGPCSSDADCASGCCDFKFKCRAPLSLKTGVEFCQNGFTAQFTGAPCPPEKAIGNPVQVGDGNAGEVPDAVNPPNNVIDTPGVTPIAFTVVDCRNSGFAPSPGNGGQFVTGACQKDDDCGSGCCELNANNCRNAPALVTGKQFCKNGFTPVFDGPRTCENLDDALGDAIFANGNTGGNVNPAPVALPTPPPVTPAVPDNNAGGFLVPNCRNVAFAPKPGSGSQFVTGPCQTDDECASGCCELKANNCRNALALATGVLFCKNGFTPVFDALPDRRVCSEGEAIVRDNGNGNGLPAGTPPPVAQTQAPAPNQPIRFETPNCRNTANAPTPQPAGVGTFVTDNCGKDSDCNTNCCDLNNKCRNPLALATGVEFCKDGFTPVFDGAPCANAASARLNAVFTATAPKAYTVPGCNNIGYANPRGLGLFDISAACRTDSDCNTGCCELNSKICVSPLRLETGVQFCTNGWTAQFQGEPCTSATSAVGDAIKAEDGGLGTAAIAGIVVAGVALIVAGTVLVRRRAAANSESGEPADVEGSHKSETVNPYFVAFNNQQQVAPSYGQTPNL